MEIIRTRRVLKLWVISFLVVITSVSIVDAQVPNYFTGNGATNSWDDPNNWSYGIVPVNAFTNPQGGWDDPNFCPIPGVVCYPLTPDPNDDYPNGNNNTMFQTNDTTILVDSSVYAKSYGVRVGNGGATNTLHITGGRLDVGVNPDGTAGNGGAGWHLQVGRGYPGFGGGPINPDPLATVLMSGGVINTNGLLIPEQFVDNSLPDPTDSAPLNGELIMSGGTINARWMNLGQLKGNGSAELSGNAVINIAGNVVGDPSNGGHLSFNRDWYLNGQPVPSSGEVSLDIRDNAIINIYGHLSELIPSPDASEITRYQSHIDAGELTADNGNDEPTLYLNQAEGVLKICALDADFDSDCDVDDVDKATWETNYGLGSGALKTDGDANNDGRVDGLDFLELQREYGVGVDSGASLATAATVPEPASVWMLAIMGTVTCLLHRRKHEGPLGQGTRGN